MAWLGSHLYACWHDIDCLRHGLNPGVDPIRKANTRHAPNEDQPLDHLVQVAALPDLVIGTDKHDLGFVPQSRPSSDRPRYFPYQLALLGGTIAALGL